MLSGGVRMVIDITFIETKITDVLHRRGIFENTYIRKRYTGMSIIPDEKITKRTKFGAFIDRICNNIDNWRRMRHSKKYSCRIIYNYSLKQDLKKAGIKVKVKKYLDGGREMWIKKQEDAVTFKILFHDTVIKYDNSIPYKQGSVWNI